jgi:DNA-binding NarL/FixJ family response regulator
MFRSTENVRAGVVPRRRTVGGEIRIERSNLAIGSLRIAARANEDADHAGSHLTPRQLQVVTAVAIGKVDKTTAAELGISERTVRFHLAAIRTRLRCHSRAAAVARAVALGLVDLDPGT